MCPALGERARQARPLVVALGAAFMVAGCASPAARRAEAPSAGRQAASWELILPGSRLAHLAPDLEEGRRDDSLNPQVEGPLLAVNEWPEAPRPRLDRPRRVYMSSGFRDYVYFRSWPSRRFEGWHWYP